jgi:hypothetical protein
MKTITLLLSSLCFLFLTGCQTHEKSFIIIFEGKNFEKKWAIKELNSQMPSDWSSSGFLTFEMKSSTTQRFDLRIFDTSGVRRLTIQPFQNAWIRASIPLIHFQQRNTKGMDLAAIGKTARPGYWIGFSGSVGPVKMIDSLGVSMRLPIGNPTLEIRNIKLTVNAMDSVFGPYPLVDEFGQWIPAGWEGKAKSLEDLQTAWKDEEDNMPPGNLSLSKYGGFTGTKAMVTGFFHVEKINNIWWFVDPEGYLFFSTGSTGIGPRSEFARIKGREYIFKALPPSEDIAAANTTVTQSVLPGPPAAYSFYSWNLYRRFGKEWYRKWMDLTIRRMDSWGLNTIANWSDQGICNSQRKTYVATLRGWGIETGTMGMPDIYDPGYSKMVDAAAERQCTPKKNDPFLLGYFLGNEPAWPNRELELVNVILSGKETPMQAALKKYLGKGDTPENRKAFIFETYAKFINTINSAIKKYDPNHLNLGLRFGGSVPEQIILASKGFDVFSFNSYGYTVNQNTLKKFSDLTGLPMIIGEFHFGVPGRGLAPGLAQTVNQEERAVAYRYYVENAAANPYIIGTHWFQWIDQPSTGRNDGENYNIGFLDVTDRPYTELVIAAKETTSRLLNIHSGKEPPVSRQALTQ